MPTYSKKEYFLAQIREKDSIIESLIKEVCVRLVVYLTMADLILSEI
jgi:hypothetical protein